MLISFPLLKVCDCPFYIKQCKVEFNSSIIAQISNLLPGLGIVKKTNKPEQHTQAHNAEKMNTQSSLKEI